jgi:hypothetical protein
MPELQEEAAVLLVDGLGDQRPPLDLIQAGCLVETAHLDVQLLDAESGKGDAATKSQTLGLL